MLLYVSSGANELKNSITQFLFYSRTAWFKINLLYRNSKTFFYITYAKVMLPLNKIKMNSHNRVQIK